MHCWEKRGCADAMAFYCPHDTTGICPRACIYTICENPQHEHATGMEVFSACDVDFSASRKENCHSCKFFLEHAPRISEKKAD